MCALVIRPDNRWACKTFVTTTSRPQTQSVNLGASLQETGPIKTATTQAGPCRRHAGFFFVSGASFGIICHQSPGVDHSVLSRRVNAVSTLSRVEPQRRSPSTGPISLGHVSWPRWLHEHALLDFNLASFLLGFDHASTPRVRGKAGIRTACAWARNSAFFVCPYRESRERHDHKSALSIPMIWNKNLAVSAMSCLAGEAFPNT